MGKSELAELITRAGKGKSYWIIKWLADKDLVDNCVRAYGYFRWVDDVVDEELKTKRGRVDFVSRQREIVKKAYVGQEMDGVDDEERVVVELIGSKTGKDEKLRSFVEKFLEILEFDARRKGEVVSQKELEGYVYTLARAVTDCIQHFVGNGLDYPGGKDQYLAAEGACVAHMLRDMRVDVENGYVNIPEEFLRGRNVAVLDWESDEVVKWVRGRVELARKKFDCGKRYLNDLGVWRCRLVGYLYWVRFEWVLEQMEKDEFVLRREYELGGWRKRWKMMKVMVKVIGDEIRRRK